MRCEEAGGTWVEREKGATDSSDEGWRENMQNAWAALHMIRQTIETLAAGTLPSEEAVLELHGPEPVHEAQAIDALRTVLATPRTPARVVRFTKDTKNPDEWLAYSGGLRVARIMSKNRGEASEREWSWYMQDIVSAEPEVMDTHGLRTLWARRRRTSSRRSGSGSRGRSFSQSCRHVWLYRRETNSCCH
jgi:hypothetical protein